ncbi:MAG: hypothetical protein K8T89_09805 [Planctomycetes bacterium]|nr:hypothetical protein [Planctomycetota bacterium]
MISRQLGLDAGLAGALIVALVTVYFVDRRSPTDGSAKETKPKLTVEIQNETTGGTVAKPLAIAVTHDDRVFDEVGKLLDELGQGYAYTKLPLVDISDFSKIGQYDLLFLTCGTQPKAWLGKPVGVGTRPEIQNYSWNEDVIKEIRASLLKFLEKGGTIVASDWQFAILSVVFPDYIDRSTYNPGAAQTLEATIADAGLSEVLGAQQLQLKFDLDDWKPAAIKAPKMKIYLEGEYRAMADRRLVKAPLLVKFPQGQGQVIFTSFHNEKQNSKKEMQLLRYLVFTAVTSRIETTVTTTLVQGGFSPVKQSLLSVNGGAQTVKETYVSKKAGRLRFVLGFAAEGAEMELTVTAPDGATTSKKGTSTFQIEFDDATVGNYQYSVTGHKVPYPNFPFRLEIADK